jgi:hypothetical protein
MRRLMILGSALVMLTTMLGCHTCGDCNSCGLGGLCGPNVHGRCDCDDGPQYGCHHPMAGASSYGHMMPMTPAPDGMGMKTPEQLKEMPKEDK